MPQNSYRNGVNLDPMVVDYLLKKKDKNYNPMMASNTSVAENDLSMEEQTTPSRTSKTLEILNQLEAMRAAKATPEYMRETREMNQPNIMLDMAPAFSKSMAQLGTLGGQAADSSSVDQFGQALEKNRARYQANEAQSDQFKDQYDQARLMGAQEYDALSNKEAERVREERRYKDTQKQKKDSLLEKSKGIDKVIEGIDNNGNPVNYLYMNDGSVKTVARAPKEDTSSMYAGSIQSVNDTGDPVNYLVNKKGQVINTLAGKEPLDKKLNKDAYDAAGYGRRVEASNEIMDNLSKDGFDRTSLKSGLSSMLPNSLISGKQRVQDQAERNFVNAVLRRESGSAISDKEFESAKMQYFPRFGDTAEVLANKEQSRLQALENFKKGAGKAWEQILPVERPPINSRNSSSFEAIASPKMKERKQGDIFVHPNGKTYIFNGTEFEEQ